MPVEKSPSRGGKTPLARHAVQRERHPLLRVLSILGVVLAVVAVSAAGVAAYAVWDTVSALGENSVELGGDEALPPSIGEIEGGVNLLLVGTDACEEEYSAIFGGRCKGKDAAGELNDVNMLVHISDNPRRVTVVSLPRDLMIPIPSCTDPETGKTSSAMNKQMLNSSYYYGGLNCVVQTVQTLTGIPIQFSAKITWGGVIEITNAIGGVEVCLANGIKDRDTGINWPAGNRTIQGIDALQFLRTRHGVGNGGDLGRISNQQQYMSRLANKLVSEEVLTNPATLYKLATTAVDNITPSQSLTNPLTLVQIALAVKNVPFSEIVFIQYPVNEDPADRNRLVPNYEAAEALWAALATNQPLQLTGEVSQGDGVVLAEPTPGATPDPAATPAPTETAIELPSSIAGQTAAQETCSNGNVKG